MHTNMGSIQSLLLIITINIVLLIGIAITIEILIETPILILSLQVSAIEMDF